MAATSVFSPRGLMLTNCLWILTAKIPKIEKIHEKNHLVVF